MKNTELFKKIESVLLTVQSPARYIGGELNTFMPEENASVRAAVCYPDLYEVGMANSGIGILYNVANAMEGVSCERVFAVAPDFEKRLREEKIPLSTLESFTPLNELDLIAFNISHELMYTNILQILDLGGIPLQRRDRKDGDPIIIGGGESASNPFPASDFIDLFFIGEGEEGFPEKLAVIKKCKEDPSMTRDKIISELSQIEGVLNPADYNFSWEGTSVDISPYKRVKMRKHAGIGWSTEKPVVPSIRISHERAVVEVARGCYNLCKFCHAGYYNLPYRPCSVKDVKENLCRQLSNTGYNEVSLAALSVSDYRDLAVLMNEILPELTSRGISISLPSLKVDKNTLPILQLLSKIRKSSLTFAVESASQELRSISNKKVKTADILDIAEFVFSHGWRLIKFYFMIGLPGCDEVDEATEIAELVRAVLAVPGKGKREINVTISPFIPKAHTPFQWAQQKGDDYLMDVIRKVKSMVPRSVKVKNHDTRSSYLEGLFSRGDSRLGSVILRAYEYGARLDSWKEYFDFRIWQRAVEEEIEDVSAYFSERDRNSSYPWQVIETGNERAVESMYERTLDLENYSQPENRYGIAVDEVAVLQAMEKFEEKYETKSRVRFEFSKAGTARFIPHLDLMEIVKRAMRMSDFPMAFTQGFNKREKISAGYPVPLGIESSSEIVDVESCEDLSESELSVFAESIVGHLPDGIRLNSVKPKYGKESVMAETAAVQYELHFADEKEACGFYEKFQQVDSFARKNKSGKDVVVQKDQSVLNCSHSGSSVNMILVTGTPSSMRIDAVVSAATGVPFVSDNGVRVMKTCQFRDNGGTLERI